MRATQNYLFAMRATLIDFKLPFRYASYLNQFFYFFKLPYSYASYLFGGFEFLLQVQISIAIGS